MSPTLYYLIFELNMHGDYDVFETHRGQEDGCIMTNREVVDTISRDELNQFIDTFADKCAEYGDKLVSCEVVL